MAAAVVELDSLADAVRPAAEDHDLLARLRRGLVLGLVARVQVRREALELGRAGIDAVEDGAHAQLLAVLANLERFGAQCARPMTLSLMPSRFSFSISARVDVLELLAANR